MSGTCILSAGDQGRIEGFEKKNPKLSLVLTLYRWVQESVGARTHKIKAVPLFFRWRDPGQLNPADFSVYSAQQQSQLTLGVWQLNGVGGNANWTFYCESLCVCLKSRVQMKLTHDDILSYTKL